MMAGNVDIQPLTLDRWGDLERLFSEPGDAGRCWCMWWYLKGSEFSALGRDGRKRGLHDMVLSGHIPGILAYRERQPVGWCALGPREGYGRLERSRMLRRVDEQAVWSIVCFFVSRTHRGRGLMTALLDGAVDFASSQGARIIEAYPHEFGEKRGAPGDAYTGVVSTFAMDGFREVGHPNATQRIMRFVVSANGANSSPGAGSD